MAVGLVAAERRPLPIPILAVAVAEAGRALLTLRSPPRNLARLKHIPLLRLFLAGVDQQQVPLDQTEAAEITLRLQLGLGPQL